MATIVTVHGTFADSSAPLGALPNDPPNDPTAAAPAHAWWRQHSAFAREVQSLVHSAGQDGTETPVNIEPFVWSGENSETGRRLAGAKLLDRLLVLESLNEPYVVVGHSHGGSVIAAALINSLSRRVALPNLQRWITIGTPFVGLRPYGWFVQRLNLMQRVVLVGSLMLLLMFIVHIIAQLLDHGAVAAPLGLSFSGGYRGGVRNSDAAMGYDVWRLALAALLLSIPAFLFSGLFRIFDRRKLFFYRQPTIEAARKAFGHKWVSFVHDDDEAVQGLQSLPRASVQLFDANFATQRLTLLAVIALPLAYVLALTSSSTMVGFADLLKERVYHVSELEPRMAAYDAERQKVRNRFRDAAREQRRAEPNAPDWSSIRKLRRDLTDRFPDHVAIERAIRFKRHFLMQQDGKPCPGGRLCGEGQNLSLNSSLAFHIITDDVTSSVFNDDTKFGNWAVALRVAIPMIVVPLASIAVALILMWLIGLIAKTLSAVAATVLNRVTMAEIKRTIYGNDTIGEIAVSGGSRPAWMPVSPPYLPAAVASRITDHANAATSASLSKFRNALSTIAMSDSVGDSSLVSNYLTWTELIHTAYFELPEFRHLFARAVADATGFRPSAAFLGHPDYGRTAEWLAAVQLPATAPAGVSAVTTTPPHAPARPPAPPLGPTLAPTLAPPATAAPPPAQVRQTETHAT
jgi:hypothetical protein